jgi:hypothetical protein
MSCVTDSGYISATTIKLAGTVVAAGLRLNSAYSEATLAADSLIENYKKQRDIQNRAMSIAESQNGQMSGVFWPAEQAFLAEYGNPEAVEEIEVIGRRYAGRLVSTILGSFAEKISMVKCSMPRHCTSANMRALQDLYAARAFAVASARTLGREIGFAEYQARHDRNWERRNQAAAIGRKGIGDAAALMKSAAQGLAAQAEGLSGQVNASLQSLGHAARMGLDGLRNSFDHNISRGPGSAEDGSYDRLESKRFSNAVAPSVDDGSYNRLESMRMPSGPDVLSDMGSGYQYDSWETTHPNNNFTTALDAAGETIVQENP